MKFLEKLRDLGVKALISKTQAMNIRETGLPGGNLADRLCEAIEAGKTGVAAALNNADTDMVLLSVLETEPENVMKGICAVAMALGTEEKVLYVPENRTELAENLASLAEEYGVTVKCAFVNVRENEDNLLIHIGTAADLAQAIEGDYTPGVWVSVDGGELQKVADGTPVSALCDLTDAKGLILGYAMHPVKDASLPVEEAGIQNGVVRVLRSTDCVVAETQKRLLASRARSCGKCVFCREGLLQLEYEHREMTQGRGKQEYIDYTHEIGEAMAFSTPCTMGQNSARIALSAQDNFAGEFEAHIKKKRCPSAACTKLVNIYIDPRRCVGCGSCMDVCPNGCIEGRPGYIYTVDDYDCTKCGECAKVCDVGAVIITTGRVPHTPQRPTKVGRFRD